MTRCAHEPCRKPVPVYRTTVPELRGRVTADRFCSRECCERAHGVEPVRTPMGMHYP